MEGIYFLNYQGIYSKEKVKNYPKRLVFRRPEF